MILCGCPSVRQPPQKPVLAISEVAKPVSCPSSAALETDDECALEVPVEFSLSNPNRFAVSLRAVDWELALAGSRSVRGRADVAVEVPGGASRRVRLVLRIVPGVSAEMLTRLASGARDYHLRGTAHIVSASGDLGLAFDQVGAWR